jgi:hypothetical protein
LYKCGNCGRQFLGGERMININLWSEYVKGKQTYAQLASKYGCSIKTIQRRLDKVSVINLPKKPRPVVILTDTTYWSRTMGLMLFKDAISKENLLSYYVKSETNEVYIKGVEELQKQGFQILAIVCDGRKGFINCFKNIPIQLCQFHQCAIIRRYLTKKPKLLAAIELLEIVDLLTKVDKVLFILKLSEWQLKWATFLKERTVNEITKKSFYTHKKLRSAYRSLNTNLPWLFTYRDYPDIKIPNTTNTIDGHFADLKNKLRNHNGLSLDRKKKFINEFLKV